MSQKEYIFSSLPKIVVSISDKESNQKIQSLPIDILEIRVDHYKDRSGEYLYSNILHRRDLGMPLILTIRNQKDEGAVCPYLSDDIKYDLFCKLIDIVDIVDVELTSPINADVIHLAKQHNKLVILSRHNLYCTPEVSWMESILQESLHKGADIIKIAARANSREDVINLLEFVLKYKDKNIVVMSLGEIGAISRLMFPFAGSMFTYSYINYSMADGQVCFSRLYEDMSFYKLRPSIRHKQ